MKRNSSYIGELSTGYTSDTIVEYDPATTEGQIGKEENDKVTTENIWENDKHLPMGLGVLSFKEAAIKLRRVARQLSVMEMDYQNQLGVQKEAAVNIASEKDLAKIANKIQCVANELLDLNKKAQSMHPIETQDEPWLEEDSPQTGDEEWVDIGEAKFDDPRNEIGIGL